MSEANLSIGIISTSVRDGGGYYEKIMFESLKHSLGNVNVNNYSSKSSFKLFNVAKHFLHNIGIKGNHDIWIRDVMGLTTLPFDKTHGKNLCIFHHFDDSHKSIWKRLANYPLNAIFFSALKEADGIIVVSQYWKNYFEKLGYSNIFLLYNPFDLEAITSFQPHTNEFKQKYQFNDKPIIYIGNCQKAKGVVEVYQVLKDLDVHLVTSGKKDVEIPARHLDLSYQEYLTLLKVSSVVVTMSKFKEGWCRTAHEAMLCGTPVVGSGLGGMGELLHDGGQIICNDFTKLRQNIEQLLNNPDIGQVGKEYAMQRFFSTEFFGNRLHEIVDSITNPK